MDQQTALASFSSVDDEDDVGDPDAHPGTLPGSLQAEGC